MSVTEADEAELLAAATRLLERRAVAEPLDVYGAVRLTVAAAIRLGWQPAALRAAPQLRDTVTPLEVTAEEAASGAEALTRALKDSGAVQWSVKAVRALRDRLKAAEGRAIAKMTPPTQGELF